MKTSFKIFVSLLILVTSFASQAQTTGTTPTSTPSVSTTSTTTPTPVVTTTSSTTPTPSVTTTSTTTPAPVVTTTTTSAPVASVPTTTTTTPIPVADTSVVTPAPTPAVTTTSTVSTTPATSVATPTAVKPVSKPKPVAKKIYKPAPVVATAAPTPTPVVAPTPVVVAAATPEKSASSNSGQKGKKTFGVTGSGYYEINSDYESVYFSFPTTSTNTAGFGVNTYFEYGFSEKVTGEISLGFSRLTYASQSRTLIKENYFMSDIVAHIYFLDNDKFATYGIAGASVYASSSAIAPMVDVGVGNYFKITENFSIKTELHLKSAVVLNRAEAKIGVAYHF